MNRTARNLILPVLLFTAGACPAFARDREKTPEEKIQALYDYFEKGCLARGWSKVTLEVEGRTRRLLWKGPGGRWTRGAVVAMHDITELKQIEEKRGKKKLELGVILMTYFAGD